MKINFIKNTILSLAIFILPVVASAASAPKDFQGLIQRFMDLIQLAVPVLMSLAVLGFLYGVATYMWKGSESDAARKEGSKFMMWGIIALFVMVSIWGLVGILDNTIFGGSSSSGAGLKTLPANTSFDYVPS